jgi:hypothetical protein
MAILITTFYYDSSPARREELYFSLENNLNNPFFDSIVLFVDQSFPTNSVAHPKIRFVISNSRIPTFGEFLSYAATAPDGSTIVIANTDICFDHEIERIKIWE